MSLVALCFLQSKLQEREEQCYVTGVALAPGFGLSRGEIHLRILRTPAPG